MNQTTYARGSDATDTDAGVTTRLRVVRLEAQMCDERSAVSTR